MSIKLLLCSYVINSLTGKVDKILFRSSPVNRFFSILSLNLERVKFIICLILNSESMILCSLQLTFTGVHSKEYHIIRNNCDLHIYVKHSLNA